MEGRLNTAFEQMWRQGNRGLAMGSMDWGRIQ